MFSKIIIKYNGRFTVSLKNSAILVPEYGAKNCKEAGSADVVATIIVLFKQLKRSRIFIICTTLERFNPTAT